MYRILEADNEDPNHIAWTRKMIWAFYDRINMSLKILLRPSLYFDRDIEHK